MPSSPSVPSALSAPSAISLPSVATTTGPMLTALTAALGVERSILAGDDQIEHAWSNLPRLLSRVPIEQRSETLVRMCVAVATGLFDSAVNYAWNAAIIELRDKVRRFGLTVVPQITGRSFDENVLIDLKDAELLQLCLKLNLISEDGYFLLDQCRDIRNNFSAAHPSVGVLDEDEFVNFLNRIGRHALANERNPRGVDIQAFISAIKSGRFNDVQFETWRSRVADTFDAQRELLFGTLHGIYCDPSSGEEARVNALRICEAFSSIMTPKAQSDLVSRHQDYRAAGDEPRHRASQQFFERLGFLAQLGDTELHSVIVSATKNLLSIHAGFNNFYNEPPFAERLAGLVAQNRVPDSAQHEFVDAVVTCAAGNQYGVSHAAMPTYEKLIRSFSPAEILIMLGLPAQQNVVAKRVHAYGGCRTRFINLIRLLDTKSIPTPARAAYDIWMAEGAAS
ncbi:MAG TPA: hypothetical protein VM689_13475 [Aliidongia sp.]|nr:hypothetical protein [Aliidongia sp.]